MDDFVKAELRMDSVELLAGLTPKQREAWLLWQVGYTQEEIGRICEISQPGAYKRIHGAIMNLRRGVIKSA